MSDTSEITNGSLVHYDSSHIQTRRDFMGLCQYNRDEFAGRRKQEPNQECMAKIVRLIETLTDHAKAEWKLKAMAAEEKGLHKPFLPKRFPVALSNEVIVRLLYRTFGESTVRNSLNYLLEIGYIGREQEKKNAIPLYWLEQKYVQALLKAQAEVTLAGYEFRPPSYQGAISYPGGVISDPSSVNSRPGHSQPGSESTDNNIDKIREKEKDIPEKESERAFAFAHAPLAPVDFLPEETHEHDAQTDRPAADHDPLPGSSARDHALVGATADVEEDAPTAHRIPAIKIGATHGQLNTLTASASIPGEPENSPLSVHSPHSLQGTDGAATGPEGSEPRASGGNITQITQEKPKRTRKKPVQVQLTLHEQEVKEWYEELRGVEVSFSKKNVTALQALGKRTMTKDDFLNVTAILDGDTWFEEHKIGVDLYWIERQWENKIIFLQRKKPPLADKKPMDVYTAASLDPERNKRNLERLKANRLAKEAAARQGGVN